MLDAENLNLRDLTTWLLTPARCGVYLSADDLTRIGEQLELRIMAMSRRSALERLFQAAALDGSVDDFFGAIIREFQCHRAVYISLKTPALERWIAQVEAAISTLSDLQLTWQVHDQNVEGR